MWVRGSIIRLRVLLVLIAWVLLLLRTLNVRVRVRVDCSMRCCCGWISGQITVERGVICLRKQVVQNFCHQKNQNQNFWRPKINFFSALFLVFDVDPCMWNTVCCTEFAHSPHSHHPPEPECMNHRRYATKGVTSSNDDHSNYLIVRWAFTSPVVLIFLSLTCFKSFSIVIKWINKTCITISLVTYYNT